MSDYIEMQQEQPALHRRLVRLRPKAGASMLIHLEEGRLTPGEEADPIPAPAYCYWPHPGPGEVILEPGSRACLLWLGDDIRQDAIGTWSESFDLRLLTDAPFVVLLEDPVRALRALGLMNWLRSEVAAVAAPSTMLLASILRLVLIEAHRLRRSESPGRISEQTTLLRHFRHLVESHYAEHWRIADYADALGVSYERLHRLCRNELDRSPADLVNQRLTAEARDRLERSGAPLKKIAADLGFSDASRFSHYFKRRTGLSPGAWRTVAARTGAEDRESLRQGFADWP